MKLINREDINIRSWNLFPGTIPSGGSTQKASASWVASKGVLIKTILEAGDLAHASTAYRHYIKCLPEAVTQRIVEQISGSVQANVVGRLDVDIDPEPD